MSLKGLQKGVARAPQILRQNLGMGELTIDANYQELEQTIKRLEKQLEDLVLLSKRYPFCVENNLKYQAQFFGEYAAFFTSIDPADKASSETIQTVRAATEYQAVARGLQLEVKPTLDSFELRIATPARRGIEILRTVKRTMEKRNHKQLDHDRHRVSLKKLQDRADRSFKEERNLYKVENEAEHSTQDFHYFNDLLKRELPMLIELEKKFIQPLFSILYLLQLDVEKRIHEGFKKVDSSFLDQTGDIEAVFRLRRGDVRERAETMSILHSRRIPIGSESRYKQTNPTDAGTALAGSELPPPYPLEQGGAATGAMSMPQRPSSSEKEAQLGEKSTHGLAGAGPDPVLIPQPGSKSNLASHGNDSAPKISAAMLSDGTTPATDMKPKEMPAVPPRTPSSGPSPGETATALYPFDAQQPGDLTFDEGDQIEILQRSDSPNEWWIGRVKGIQGQFPGNYVSLNGAAAASKPVGL